MALNKNVLKTAVLFIALIGFSQSSTSSPRRQVAVVAGGATALVGMFLARIQQQRNIDARILREMDREMDALREMHNFEAQLAWECDQYGDGSDNYGGILD